MVHLAPSISFVKVLIEQLEQGQSIFQAIKVTAEQESTPFATKVYLWTTQQRTGARFEVWVPKSHFQMSLMQVLLNGLGGSPVYEELKQLVEEMEMEFERQWKHHLEVLPVKLSVPLLLFFFPAYVIMLFGPLLSKFLMEVQ